MVHQSMGLVLGSPSSQKLLKIQLYQQTVWQVGKLERFSIGAFQKI
jgi:hypothetical protein